MLRIGIGIAIGFASVSADAIQTFFEQLEQTFTLDDEARGILDNDALA